MPVSDNDYIRSAFTPLSSRARMGDIYSQKIIDHFKTHSYTEIESYESYIGFAVQRTYIFDAAVRCLLVDKPDAVIVNLGCGFCTRYHRIDNGKVTWYDIDFKQTLEVKMDVFPQTDRLKYLAMNLRNHDEIPVKYDYLVAEGFIYQLPLEQAKRLITRRSVFDVQGMGRTSNLGRDQHWRFDPKDWNLTIFNKWVHDKSPGREAYVMDCKPA